MPRQTLPIPSSIICSFSKKLCHQVACNIRCSEPMSHHASFRIGGTAPWLIVPFDAEALIQAVALLKNESIDYRLIGKASNLLIPENPLPYAVLSTAGLDSIRWKKSGDVALLEVGSGIDLTRLSWFLSQKGYTGLEFACGIPGSVGGGVWMNAGAFGGAMASVVRAIHYYDPISNQLFCMTARDAAFAYRSSLFQSHPDWIILSVELELHRSHTPEIPLRVAKTHIKKRWENQPLDFPSAGSVFRKPSESFHVGKAIEALGLKGFRLGGAEVSTKHAGFIINRNKAKYEDVLNMIAYIQNEVRNHYMVQLEPEVQIWGIQE